MAGRAVSAPWTPAATPAGEDRRGDVDRVDGARTQSTDLDAMATTRRQGRAKVGQGPEGLAIHAQQHVAGLDARTGVAHQRQRRVLARVKVCDVNVDEAHVGVLESSLGRGHEIAVSGADADDKIGVVCQTIRASSSSGPKGAQ